MKKKLFTTILTVAVAATTLFSNTLTTKAAEQPKTNPLVQQLNALTENYIGYDMTYADKVKVLNACFASSAAMQNYTLVVEPSYAYNHVSQINTIPETKPSTRVTKTFLYDHGNYMFDYSDSITGQHTVDFCTPNSWYSNVPGPVWYSDKANGVKYVAANDPDANYAGKLHQCAYSVEELATVGQYTEIEGQPYLVCTFHPETAGRAGCYLDPGEALDSANSRVVFSISLSNYGAFSISCDLHVFAAPNDPIVPNGHAMFHRGCSYTNVNTTTIPAVPSSYFKVF